MNLEVFVILFFPAWYIVIILLKYFIVLLQLRDLGFGPILPIWHDSCLVHIRKGHFCWHCRFILQNNAGECFQNLKKR